LSNKPLDKLLTSLLEDKIAIILHLLTDIVDGIGIQLTQLTELSESALDDEGQSEQKVPCLLRTSEMYHAFNHLSEKQCVRLHVLDKTFLLIAYFLSYCVNLQNFVQNSHEVQRLVLYIQFWLNEGFRVVEIILLKEKPDMTEKSIEIHQIQLKLFICLP